MSYSNRLAKHTVERDDATTVYAPNMLNAFICNIKGTTPKTQYVSVEDVDVQSY